MAFFNFKKKKGATPLQNGITFYENGNLNEAANIFKSLADKGDIEACYWFGRILYEDGTRYQNEENLATSQYYLNFAAQNGHTQAQQILAMFPSPQGGDNGYYNYPQDQQGNDPYNNNYMDPNAASPFGSSDFGPESQNNDPNATVGADTPFGFSGFGPEPQNNDPNATVGADTPFGFSGFGSTPQDDPNAAAGMNTPFGPSGFRQNQQNDFSTAADMNDPYNSFNPSSDRREPFGYDPQNDFNPAQGMNNGFGQDYYGQEPMGDDGVTEAVDTPYYDNRRDFQPDFDDADETRAFDTGLDPFDVNRPNNQNASWNPSGFNSDPYGMNFPDNDDVTTQAIDGQSPYWETPVEDDDSSVTTPLEQDFRNPYAEDSDFSINPSDSDDGSSSTVPLEQAFRNPYAEDNDLPINSMDSIIDRPADPFGEPNFDFPKNEPDLNMDSEADVDIFSGFDEIEDAPTVVMEVTPDPFKKEDPFNDSDPFMRNWPSENSDPFPSIDQADDDSIEQKAQNDFGPFDSWDKEDHDSFDLNAQEDRVPFDPFNPQAHEDIAPSDPFDPQVHEDAAPSDPFDPQAHSDSEPFDPFDPQVHEDAAPSDPFDPQVHGGSEPFDPFNPQAHEDIAPSDPFDPQAHEDAAPSDPFDPQVHGGSEPFDPFNPQAHHFGPIQPFDKAEPFAPLEDADEQNAESSDLIDDSFTTEPVEDPFVQPEWNGFDHLEPEDSISDMSPEENLDMYAEEAPSADFDSQKPDPFSITDGFSRKNAAAEQPNFQPAPAAIPPADETGFPLNDDPEDDEYGHTIHWSNRYSTAMEQRQLQNASNMAENGDYSGALNIWRRMSRNGSSAAQDAIGTCYRYGNGVKQNLESAIFSYEIAGDQHFIPALLHLADLYENDLGDLTSAAKWYERAAAEGDNESAFKAAEFYTNQMQNYSKALPLYQQALESGNVVAASRLGRMYLFGLGTEVNYPRAFSLCLRSACTLDTAALDMLGIIYENGYSVNVNRKEAILYHALGQKCGLSSSGAALERLNGSNYIGTDLLPLSLQQALQENPGNATEEALALLQISVQAREEIRARKAARRQAVQATLDRVHEIEKERAAAKRKAARNAYQLTRAESAFAKGDYNTSFRLWTELSKEEGMGAAQNALGKCYTDGLGTEKDLDRALYWYNEAAKNDITDAMTSAGLLEFNLNKDFTQAYNWLVRSAAREDIKGMCALADILSNPDSGYTDFAQAVSLYEKASAKNYPSALSGLGVLYLTGRGVSRDIEKANDYFISAAMNLDQTALLYLGLLFEQGFEPTITANPEEASRYYALAGKNGADTSRQLQKLNASEYADSPLLPQSLESAIDAHPEQASQEALKAYEASKLAALKMEENDED